jgi:translation initiation factor 4E
MTSVSSLPGPALQASRSAVQAALAEHPEAEALATAKDGEDDDEDEALLEPGEIQEVDMQAQVETIRTVFSDPKTFNVKVRCFIDNLPARRRSHLLSLSTYP